jgi:hypothetical protein
MALYRFPFGDAGWSLGQGNWDDPNQAAAHQKAYAFDFGHAEGGEIRATRAGVVIDLITSAAKNSWPTPPDTVCDPNVPSGGNGVLIRHADGTVSTYAHLQYGSIKVQQGSWVAQGQVIAHSGNTGCSSDPHCHFEVFLLGKSYTELGPSIPIDLEDNAPGARRPKAGEAIHSDNTILRQDGWRWCHKCRGLFFEGANLGSDGGTCPMDHKEHSAEGSGNYILPLEYTGAASQAGWRWCSKCQGLFFGANPGSVCPASGGGHQDSGGYYVLAHNSVDAQGQGGWRWCKKCQGLFFNGSPNAGSAGECPADQGEHSGVGSGHYTLELDQSVQAADLFQTGWRYCGKCQGLFFGLHPNSKCPAGKAHVDMGSYYTLMYDLPKAPGQEPWAGPAQPGWRWCNKCQGLFFGGIQAGKCPADGTPHSGSGSGIYRLINNAPWIPDTVQVSMAPGQDQWLYCSKCQGLFFGGTPNSGSLGGTCPADQQAHNGSNSGNYTVLTSNL